MRGDIRMYENEMQLDFHSLGQEIKRKREAKGWTQEYLGQLIDRTSHSVMYIENRGQHPSLEIFYKLVVLLDISVDQFFSPKRQKEKSERRQRVDWLLDSLNEKELSVMESTAEGLIGAREIDDNE